MSKMYVVVSAGRESWDRKVYGPYGERINAEAKANSVQKFHPSRTVGVYPLVPAS